MAQISIMFGDVRGGEAESYIRQRVRLLHHASSSRSVAPKPTLSEATLKQYVSEITAGLGQVSPPPMAAPVDLSSLPKRNAAIIRRRRSCMIEEVGRLFPLLDGEHVEEDVASYPRC